MSGFGGILILTREIGAWFGGLAVPAKLTVVTIALATTGVGVAVVAPDALPISPFVSSHTASLFPAASSAKPAAPVNPSIVASAKPTATGKAATPSTAPTTPPATSASTMPGAHESTASSTKATTATTTKKATTTASASASKTSVYYKDCEAAWEAGAAPIPKNQPGYRIELDSDQNGVACEKKA